MKRKIKMLFLAANPDDETRLELGREFNQIGDAIRLGDHRDDFQLLQPQFDARIGTFAAVLAREDPHIVHFSGHGSDSDGITFENEDHYGQPAGKKEFEALFKSLKRDPRLIFLNACHTKSQAEILSKSFDYVIGTNGLIGDKHAASLAYWFYRALADGGTVEGAFLSAQLEVGKNAVGMSELLIREPEDHSGPFIKEQLDKYKDLAAANRRAKTLTKPRKDRRAKSAESASFPGRYIKATFNGDGRVIFITDSKNIKIK